MILTMIIDDYEKNKAAVKGLRKLLRGKVSHEQYINEAMTRYIFLLKDPVSLEMADIIYNKYCTQGVAVKLLADLDPFATMGEDIVYRVGLERPSYFSNRITYFKMEKKNVSLI